MGTLRLLEAIRFLVLKENAVLPGLTSELYGLVQEIPQKETTPFCAFPLCGGELCACWITVSFTVNHRYLRL